MTLCHIADTRKHLGLLLNVCIVLGVSAHFATSSALAASTPSLPRAELLPRTQNGYEFAIRASKDQVTLTVYRGLTQASYSVPARMVRRGIRANFSGVGRVAVRFKPSGRTLLHFPPKGCSGAPVTTYLGAFVGKVRFLGEESYVRLHAERVRGAWNPEVRWNCKQRRSRERAQDKRLRPGVSALAAATPGRKLFFAALSRGSGSLFSSFVVGIDERHHGMQIKRVGLALGKPYDFVRDKSSASMKVAPPPPFDGSAIFQQGVEGPGAWTGSLSVSLPGAKRNALTGPGIFARIPRPSDVQQLVELLSTF